MSWTAGVSGTPSELSEAAFSAVSASSSHGDPLPDVISENSRVKKENFDLKAQLYKYQQERFLSGRGAAADPSDELSMTRRELEQLQSDNARKAFLLEEAYKIIHGAADDPAPIGRFGGDFETGTAFQTGAARDTFAFPERQAQAAASAQSLGLSAHGGDHHQIPHQIPNPIPHQIPLQHQQQHRYFDAVGGAMRLDDLAASGIGTDAAAAQHRVAYEAGTWRGARGASAIGSASASTGSRPFADMMDRISRLEMSVAELKGKIKAKQSS